MNKSHRYRGIGSIRVFVALLLFIVTGTLAEATTLMRMSLEQMSRAAKVIVRARCIANDTIWDSGEIWTRTTVKVEETWKGAGISQQVSVRLLGGALGNITSRVSGIPRFQPGEEVVLFLEPTTSGDLSVVSWQQGTFRLLRNPQSGEEAVTQDTASFATYDAASRRFEQAGIRRMFVADFRARVEAALTPNSTVVHSPVVGSPVMESPATSSSRKL